MNFSLPLPTLITSLGHRWAIRGQLLSTSFYGIKARLLGANPVRTRILQAAGRRHGMLEWKDSFVQCAKLQLRPSRFQNTFKHLSVFDNGQFRQRCWKDRDRTAGRKAHPSTIHTCVGTCIRVPLRDPRSPIGNARVRRGWCTGRVEAQPEYGVVICPQ